MNVIEKFEEHGFVAKIVHDEHPDNPMDPKHGDPIGTITYCSNRYTLGTRCLTDASERIEIDAEIERGALVGMPVFAYIHSGIELQAAHSNPFHCPWDSGQSGVVYCTKEKACEEWGTPSEKLAMAVDENFKLSKETQDKALKYMAGEVETFCQYLNGECFGIIIENLKGADVESVWGFYGLDYATGEAKRMLAETASRRNKKRKRK